MPMVKSKAKGKAFVILANGDQFNVIMADFDQLKEILASVVVSN